MKLKYYIEQVKNNNKKTTNKTEEQLINYFLNNKISKDTIEIVANNLNKTIDEIHELLYELLNQFLNVGKFKDSGMTINDINANELKMGIMVEFEHTSNPLIAKKIALDHLAELPDYYTRLQKIENQ